MINYSITTRGDERSEQLKDELEDKLAPLGYVRNDENPNLVFTIGGDGTMLEAVHRYMKQIESVTFIGIHTGKLGFYTDFIPEEMDKLIDYLKTDNFTESRFPLLEASVCKTNCCTRFYALNEVTLINALRTQHLDVFINEELFESFQGTGLCISTPSGSSAYNKSLGGALIHPKILSYQLTEIASINNNVYRTISSPMVLPSDTLLSLKSRDFKKVIMTIDHKHIELGQYDEIQFRLSERFVTLRQFRDNDFWRRVQKSFLY